jgi:hypothetical protein
MTDNVAQNFNVQVPVIIHLALGVDRFLLLEQKRDSHLFPKRGRDLGFEKREWRKVPILLEKLPFLFFLFRGD